MNAQPSLFPSARQCDCCGEVGDDLVQDGDVAVCWACRDGCGARMAGAMASRLPRSRAVEIVLPFTLDESLAAIRRRKGRVRAPLDHLIGSMVSDLDRRRRPALRIDLHRRSSTLIDSGMVEQGCRRFLLPTLMSTGIIAAGPVPITVKQSKGRGQLRAIVWWA